MKEDHAVGVRWAGILAIVLNAGLVSALWLWSFLEFRSLPGSIPIHFGLAGRPDRWVERTWGSWLLIPGTALGISALVGIIGLVVAQVGAASGRWLNVPAKKVFLRLPPSDQTAILRASAPLFGWVVLPMNLLLIYIQWSIAEVARLHRPGLGVGFLAAGVLLVPAIAILPVIRLRRRILDLAKERGIEK